MRPWMGVLNSILSGEQTALQWGHGLAAVDGYVPLSNSSKVHVLQWGHGLAAVDGVLYGALVCSNV